MPYDKTTTKILESIKAKIQGILIAKQLDNSGEAYASLEISGNKLLGNDYMYYLDKGRAPGKFPPVNNIQEWVRSKLGLEGNENKAVAFLIGRKISNFGTGIYQDNSKGLELEKIISESIDELVKELPDEVAAEALTWL